jgi:hypothetical protein
MALQKLIFKDIDRIVEAWEALKISPVRISEAYLVF